MISELGLDSTQKKEVKGIKFNNTLEPEKEEMKYQVKIFCSI